MQNKIFNKKTLFLAILLILLIWTYNHEKEKENTQIVRKIVESSYWAKINGVNTKIYKENGIKYAKVKYSYCEPLGYVDDCRIDNKIIKIIIK